MSLFPARGTTPWLGLSLSSLAAQSFQPAAIILIDDGLAHLDFDYGIGPKTILAVDFAYSGTKAKVFPPR